MKKKDNLGLHGQFVLVAAHQDGEVFATREILNVITTVGLASVAKLLINDSPDPAFGYIAIGIGTGSAAGDTALASEITTNGGERDVADSATAAAAVSTIALQFTFTGSFAITEVGLLNDTLASGTSILLATQDFAAINVASGDSLTATWTITHAGV